MKKILFPLLLIVPVSAFAIQGVFMAGSGGPPSGGISYGVGDVFSERFEGANDGADNVWSRNTQGGGQWNPDGPDLGVTGFVDDSLEVITPQEARADSTWASPEPSVYGRFYYKVPTNIPTNFNKNIFTITTSTGAMGDQGYINFSLRESGGNANFYVAHRNGGSWQTGSFWSQITEGDVWKVEFAYVEDGANDLIEYRTCNQTLAGDTPCTTVLGGQSIGSYVTGREAQKVFAGVRYDASAALTHYFDHIDINRTGYPTDE